MPRQLGSTALTSLTRVNGFFKNCRERGRVQKCPLALTLVCFSRSGLPTFFLKSFCSSAIFCSLTSNICCALRKAKCSK